MYFLPALHWGVLFSEGLPFTSQGVNTLLNEVLQIWILSVANCNTKCWSLVSDWKLHPGVSFFTCLNKFRKKKIIKEEEKLWKCFLTNFYQLPWICQVHNFLLERETQRGEYPLISKELDTHFKTLLKKRTLRGKKPGTCVCWMYWSLGIYPKPSCGWLLYFFTHTQKIILKFTRLSKRRKQEGEVQYTHDKKTWSILYPREGWEARVAPHQNQPASISWLWWKSPYVTQVCHAKKQS